MEGRYHRSKEIALASTSIVRSAPPAGEFRWQVVEACEKVASAALLVGLSPVLAAGAAAIGLLSGRAPLIAHKRVGWRGQTLWMLKLRSMWGGDSGSGVTRGLVEYIDDSRGPEEKQENDPRVGHWLARFCRRHSLDEIPQLWHVMTGEMSLVGPRPLTAGELRRHYGADASEILQVKPGIAGLWQISGRNRLTYPERKRLDLYLVRRRSIGLYLKILCRILPEVLSGTNTW